MPGWRGAATSPGAHRRRSAWPRAPSITYPTALNRQLLSAATARRTTIDPSGRPSILRGAEPPAPPPPTTAATAQKPARSAARQAEHAAHSLTKKSVSVQKAMHMRWHWYLYQRKMLSARTNGQTQTELEHHGTPQQRESEDSWGRTLVKIYPSPGVPEFQTQSSRACRSQRSRRGPRPEQQG